MPLLHILNKSPQQSAIWQTCLKLAQPEQGILLIEDGIYLAIINTEAANQLATLANHCNIYLLWPDVIARGVSERIMTEFTAIDYVGFVDLTVAYDKVQSWL